MTIQPSPIISLDLEMTEPAAIIGIFWNHCVFLHFGMFEAIAIINEFIATNLNDFGVINRSDFKLTIISLEVQLLFLLLAHLLDRISNEVTGQILVWSSEGVVIINTHPAST